MWCCSLLNLWLCSALPQAAAAFRLRTGRAVLVALALNAQRRRAQRRRAAIAQEHRRVGLLRRGVAALV